MKKSTVIKRKSKLSSAEISNFNNNSIHFLHKYLISILIDHVNENIPTILYEFPLDSLLNLFLCYIFRLQLILVLGHRQLLATYQEEISHPVNNLFQNFRNLTRTSLEDDLLINIHEEDFFIFFKIIKNQLFVSFPNQKPNIWNNSIIDQFWQQYPLGDLRFSQILTKLLIYAKQTANSQQLGEQNTDFFGKFYEISLNYNLLLKNDYIILNHSTLSRNHSGSYYTPDDFISIIVKLTLSPLLVQSENLIDQILKLKILDPAMGCGYFLTNTLFYLSTMVEQNLKKIDHLRSDSLQSIQQKICQNCLYGIDLDPIAVDITAITLWLEVGNPNFPISDLYTHLKCGNAILSVDPEEIGIPFAPDVQKSIKNILDLYLAGCFNEKFDDYIKKVLKSAKYLSQERVLSFDLDESITELSSQIAEKKHFFHWKIEFPEVFYNMSNDFQFLPGFDVILGNPPYHRERDGKELLDEARKSIVGNKYGIGKMDYWFFFTHLAIDHLKDDGFHAFIVPSYWIQANSSKKLATHIKDTCSIREIINFQKIQVFPGVRGQFMIFNLQKNNKTSPRSTEIIEFIPEISEKLTLDIDVHTQFKVIEPHLYDIAALAHYKFQIFSKAQDDLFRTGLRNEYFQTKPYQNLAINSIPLVALFDIHQGIAENPDKMGLNKTIRTIIKQSGLSVEDFLLKAQIQLGEGVFILKDEEKNKLALTPEEEIFVKPYFNAKDITPWICTAKNSHWILYITKKIVPDIEKFPHLFNHLLRFKFIMDQRRETRMGKNRWYELHWPRDQSIFEGTKILVPQLVKEPIFSYSKNCCYVGMSINLIHNPKSDLTLEEIWGILNSDIARTYIKETAKNRGIGVDIEGRTLKAFPIPSKISMVDRKRLSEISNSLIQMHQSKKYEPIADQKLFDKISDLTANLNEIVKKIYEIKEI